MSNGPLGLEHPVVVSDDLDALAERYGAMGFAPTRKGYHPWGTGTQLVLFADTFIELMGIDDRSLIDVPSETGFRFGRFIAEQLDRREGIAMIALHSEDAAADAAAVTARGVAPDGTVSFRREVTLPDGATDEAVVSLAMLIDWEQPQLSHFICQQHRPEFVWVAEWMRHPNGALGIAQVVYAAAEPLALGSGSPASGARMLCMTWTTDSGSRPPAANCWCWTCRPRRPASRRWRCPMAGATLHARSPSASVSPTSIG
jgi:hypothetical protein